MRAVIARLLNRLPKPNLSKEQAEMLASIKFPCC